MSSSVRKSNILHMLSYIAVIAVGLALVLSFVFKAFGLTTSLVSALNLIAQCLAYFVVSCYSFGYAKTRGMAGVITWVVAVVLIVVFLVLGYI